MKKNIIVTLSILAMIGLITNSLSIAQSQSNATPAIARGSVLFSNISAGIAIVQPMIAQKATGGSVSVGAGVDSKVPFPKGTTSFKVTEGSTNIMINYDPTITVYKIKARGKAFFIEACTTSDGAPLFTAAPQKK